MFDLITIGHSTIDIIVKIPDAHLHCRKSEKTCELCFAFGQKLAADSITQTIGGNAPNVAVGLQRLGFKTTIVSHIGRDENGLKIRSILQREKVDDSYLKEDSVNPSDVSVILSFEGERTILAHHSPFIYRLPRNLPETNWIYLTSLGKNFQRIYEDLKDYLIENSNSKLALNPGMHELKWGVQGFLGLLQRAEIIILNREEAQTLIGATKTSALSSQSSFVSEPEGMRRLLEEVKTMGPKIVVITDAANGAYLFNGENYLKIKPFSSEPVEMTGAGDAFSSGFLGAVLNNQPFEEALRWGAGEAASVISKIGSTPGLLNEKELQNLLDSQKDIVTESF